MIQLFHVSKAYPGDPPALEDVSVQVAKGELVFLTGASGAGKSTFLKLLFGQEQATAGQVLVAGQNVARLGRSEIAALRRRIGIVFQDFRLLPTRTVADNVAIPLDVLGMPRGVVRRRVAQLLRYVGLEAKADVVPTRLSGGEQQRASIARALAADPMLLLADEPTGNLDHERSEEILALLLSVNARGTTVLVATHDRQLLARFGRRVLVLERGRLVGDGGADADGVVAARSSPPPVRR
jgi:cell division transport system ATP-binding protein